MTKELTTNIMQIAKSSDNVKIFVSSDFEGNEISPLSTFDPSGRNTVLFPNRMEKNPMVLGELKAIFVRFGKTFLLSSDDEGNEVREYSHYVNCGDKVILYPKHC